MTKNLTKNKNTLINVIHSFVKSKPNHACAPRVIINGLYSELYKPVWICSLADDKQSAACHPTSKPHENENSGGAVLFHHGSLRLPRVKL